MGLIKGKKSNKEKGASAYKNFNTLNLLQNPSAMNGGTLPLSYSHPRCQRATQVLEFETMNTLPQKNGKKVFPIVPKYMNRIESQV